MASWSGFLLKRNRCKKMQFKLHHRVSPSPCPRVFSAICTMQLECTSAYSLMSDAIWQARQRSSGLSSGYSLSTAAFVARIALKERQRILMSLQESTRTRPAIAAR